jgi:hypothetical protein
MAGSRRRAPESIHQLKITLKGSKPPIWRRVLVPSDTSLPKLHAIFQVVMGWQDYHLHQFTVGETSYGEPDPDGMLNLRNERNVRLNRIAPAAKHRFAYEYDFGDGWDHAVLVEKVLPPEPGATYPVCIAGKRACPPEDCGGIWGYADFLEAISDPDHEEHDSMLEWIGGEFDPEAFDLAEVNRRLRSLA